MDIVSRLSTRHSFGAIFVLIVLVSIPVSLAPCSTAWAGLDVFPDSDDDPPPCYDPCCESGGAGGSPGGPGGGPTSSLSSPGAPALGAARPGTTAAPIYLRRGAVIEQATDVSLPPSAMSWLFSRSYDSGRIGIGSRRVTYEPGVPDPDENFADYEIETAIGRRWFSSMKGPYLHLKDGNVELYLDASSKRVFTGSGLTPPTDYDATLVEVELEDNEDKDDLDSDGDTNEDFSLFRLTENETGLVMHFLGFDENIDDETHGRVVEITNREYLAAGRAGVALRYYHSASSNTRGIGYLSTVIPAYPHDADYSLSFFYYQYGELIDRIDLNKGSTVVARAEYTYSFESFNELDSSADFTLEDLNSDLGLTSYFGEDDLVQVKVSQKDSDDTGENFSIVRYTQYRYYNTGDSDGNTHQLKMVLESDAIQRAIDYSTGDSITTPEHLLALKDSGTGGTIGGIDFRNFASRSFKYYTATVSTSAVDTDFTSGTSTENLNTKYGGSEIAEWRDFHWSEPGAVGFVKEEVIRGGCAGCGTGLGGVKKQYYYMGRTSTDTSAVTRIVVEDTIQTDGTTAAYRTVYGLNNDSVTLRQAIIEDPTLSTLKVWCSSITLDSYLKITERRMPSAHTLIDSDGSDTMQSGLKEFFDPTSGSNDANTASASAGLVYEYDYVNGSSSYWKIYDVLAKVGRTGTPYLVSATDYGYGADDEPEWAIVATYSYPTATGVSDRNNTSLAKKTQFTYDFWDTADTQIKKSITTLPTISTGQNGSGTATTTEQYFDKVGRLRWGKDGEGYVTYYSYHPKTNELSYTMVDVNDPSSPGSDITSGDNTGASGTDVKWIDWTVDGTSLSYPTRGSGLPVGLGLVTKQEYDDQGRPTVVIDTGGIKHFTVYDGNRRLRYSYWDSSNNRPLLPIDVAETNSGGALTQTYAVDPARTAYTGSPSAPTGLASDTNTSHYTRWTRYFNHTVNGQLVKTLNYHLIPSSGNGDHITNYYVMAYEYDGLGRRKTTVRTSTSSIHQLDQVEYDDLNRVVKTKRDAGSSGVDTGVNATLGTLSTSGYATMSETAYDLGGIGDSYITSTKSFYGPTISTDFIESKYYRTFRGFLRAVEKKNNTTVVLPHHIQDVDWLGRVTDAARYTTTISDFNSTVVSDDDYVSMISTNRHEWTKTRFDDLGRVYRTERYPGAESTKHFEINNYYNRNSDLVATGETNSAQTEYAYDGFGRQYQIRSVLDLESTKYTSGKFNYRDPIPDPHWFAGSSGLVVTDVLSGSMAGADDKVIEFSHNVYDLARNVVQEHTFETYHDDTDGLDFANNEYVRHSTYNWYDAADRLTTTADYGSGDTTSGAGSWKYAAVPARPTSAPTSTSETKLITKHAYNAITGRPESVIDPLDMETKTFYDNLGRRTYVSENFDNFSPPDSNISDGTDISKDRVTKWEYTGLSQVKTLTAYNGSSTGDGQVTEYLYSDPYDASLVTLAKYPDGNTTIGTGEDNVQSSYNVDGSLASRKDQRGVVIEYVYDTARRVADEKATTIPSTVYGGSSESDAVRLINRTYDSLGRLEHVKTLNATSSGSVLSHIKYSYDTTHGQLIKTEQSHEGDVTTGTRSVQYAYDATDSSGVYTNGLRPTDVTYPNGQVISKLYGSSGSVADVLSRVDNLYAGVGLTRYSYNGANRLTETDYPAPDVRRRMFDLASAGANVYNGFDRFGRTAKSAWYYYNGGNTLRDELDHTYDYVGNTLTSDIPSSLTTWLDWTYQYDGLHRVKESLLGDIGTAGSSWYEGWALDQLGNWSTFKSGYASNNLVLDQARSHNKANEIDVNDIDSDSPGASITASTGTNWADPTYDKTGNMTTMPQHWDASPNLGLTLKYDAWNHLILVKNGSDTVQQNEFDGLGRRIVRSVYTSGSLSHRIHYYYNENWQVLEERKEVSDTEITYPLNQYLWHPYYIDALAMRRYDADTDNNITENADGLYYYLHDVNYNVKAIVNGNGVIVERGHYHPYGLTRVRNGDTDADGTAWNYDSNGSDIGNTHWYTGREADPETGLQLNRHRFYSSSLGRWVTRDPVEYRGSQWNLYEYAASSPVYNQDASGLKLYIGPPKIIDPVIEALEEICPCMDFEAGKRERHPPETGRPKHPLIVEPGFPSKSQFCECWSKHKGGCQLVADLVLEKPSTTINIHSGDNGTYHDFGGGPGDVRWNPDWPGPFPGSTSTNVLGHELTHAWSMDKDRCGKTLKQLKSPIGPGNPVPQGEQLAVQGENQILKETRPNTPPRQIYSGHPIPNYDSPPFDGGDCDKAYDALKK